MHRFAEVMQEGVGLALKLGQLATTDAANDNTVRREACTNLARLQERLGRVESSIAGLAGAHETHRVETARVCTTLPQVLQRQETFAHNIEQLRLLTEPLARRLDELTAEFVNRHVSEPLFKELGRLCWTLNSLAEDESLDLRHEVRAQAEALGRLLDANEFQLIQPQPGDPFDPHHHQPVLRRVTEDAALHFRVARTVQPGLLTPGHVVQHARVEVFVLPTPKVPSQQTP